MARGSSNHPNVANNSGGGGQRVSTCPDTRAIGAGGVRAAPVPDPAVDLAGAAARATKPANFKEPTSVTNQPTNPSNASSLQVPLDPAAAVPTERTYDQGEKRE